MGIPIPKYSRVTTTTVLCDHATHLYGFWAMGRSVNVGGPTTAFCVCDSATSANWKTLTVIHGMTKRTGVTQAPFICNPPIGLSSGLFVALSDKGGSTVVVMWG